LRQLLGALPLPIDERILIGFDNAEDAAVYALDAERALIFTTDFITPIVDDPETYGRIAAVNALSDVWAMGGRPLLALSVYMLPEGFPLEVGAKILAGAAHAALAAGAPVLGGHTVQGRDLMVGLAVIGEAHPARLFRNTAFSPGDALLLTKPLGTGTLATGVKRGRFDETSIREAIDGMLLTNAAAVPPAQAAGVRAATDVTGFGLLGHAASVARASGVELVLEQAAVPAYALARETLAAGVRTGANKRNLQYARELGPLTGEPEDLLLDPQTSGGLLVAVPAAAAEALTATLRAAGYPRVSRIGEVRAGAGLRLV
jgi:selenide,water dikinase